MKSPFERAIYLETEGAKVGVILLHAYTGSPADMNFLARKLYREGYTVLCPCFKGHRTPNLNDLLDATPEDWWQDTIDAIQWMSEKSFDTLFVFGLSLGGMFAACAMTDVSLPIDAGGSFNSPVVTTGSIDLSDAFMQYARHVYQRNRKIDEFERDYDTILQRHKEQLSEIDAFVAPFSFVLDRITQPYLIVQSGEDELIDPNGAYLLEEALVNADVTLKWFPHNTHVITVNKERAVFEQTVEEFIKQNQ